MPYLSLCAFCHVRMVLEMRRSNLSKHIYNTIEQRCRCLPFITYAAAKFSLN